VDDTTRRALAALTRVLAGEDVPFQVGGSALLYALGLVDEVGDLDVVFRPEDRVRLGTALLSATGVPPVFDVGQEPGFVSGWRASHRFRGVDLDMTAAVALRYREGFVARLPFRDGSVWDVEGTPVPLAPLTDWLLVYRYHNPARAELLEPFVAVEEWVEFLDVLGAPTGFDGFRSDAPE
jgi:hypothetical protein